MESCLCCELDPGTINGICQGCNDEAASFLDITELSITSFINYLEEIGHA